jgi:lipoate-protein ligase B
MAFESVIFMLVEEKPRTYERQRNADNKDWLFLNLQMMEYRQAWDLQARLVMARKNNIIDSDILLLLEHPAVFTLGRRGGRENLIVSGEFLDKFGIPVIQIERGGNITYHGPGQLIAYPIVDLEVARLNVDTYVERLEETMIRTARNFDVQAHRNPLNRGIWVGNNKMGSIGIALRKGVSFHGLALNVNLSLEPFTWINPCGLKNVGVTSIKKESRRDVTMQVVRHVFINHFQTVFEIELVPSTLQEITQAMTTT